MKKSKVKQMDEHKPAQNPETFLSPDFCLAIEEVLFTSKDHEADIEVQNKRLEKVIKQIEKQISVKKISLEELQHINDREHCNLKEFISRLKAKPEKVKHLIEEAIKSKEENRALINELNEEKTTLKSEVEELENLQNRYKWYRNTLFKLSPSEWQKVQVSKTPKVQSIQNEQNSEPNGATVNEGGERELENVLPSESFQSSWKSQTRVSDLDWFMDNTEEMLELYFSEPSEVKVLMTELTDQILSLMYNATEKDKVLEQNIEMTRSKMQKEEERLMQQVSDIQNRIDIETKRMVSHKKRVQLHDLLKTQNQDIMLDAISKKVGEVYSCCVESKLTNPNTVEKLCRVENRTTTLLEQIENIDKEIFQKLWRMKENERRRRLREEKLQREKEKKKEKIEKCKKRALAEGTKIAGRKLMPRSMLIKEKPKVSDEPEAPVEEEPYAHFFTED